MRWKISLALAVALALGLLTTLFAQDGRRFSGRDDAGVIDAAAEARAFHDRLESIVSRRPRSGPAAAETRSGLLARKILEDPVLSRDPRARQRVWALTARAAVERVNAQAGVEGPERLRRLQEDLRAHRDRKPAPEGGSR